MTARNLLFCKSGCLGELVFNTKVQLTVYKNFDTVQVKDIPPQIDALNALAKKKGLTRLHFPNSMFYVCVEQISLTCTVVHVLARECFFKNQENVSLMIIFNLH